jgi:small-conductance mechanosensitive channel
MAHPVRHARFKKALREQFEQISALRRKVSNRTIIFFAFVFGAIELVIFLYHADYISLPVSFVRSWNIIVRISLALLLASILSRIVNMLLFKTFKEEMEIEQRIFQHKLWGFLFYLGATIFSLYQLGFSTENITLFAGFLATGFALSMREVILSYIIWAVLLFKRPFRIGDIIKIGDDEGLVEHIGTFYVRLSDGSGDPERCTRIPTKQFLEKSIQNYGTADFLEEFRIAVPDRTDARSLVEKAAVIVRRESGAKENVMVNLEADTAGAVKLVIIYPIIFERRRAVRTKVIAKVAALLKK